MKLYLKYLTKPYVSVFALTSFVLVGIYVLIEFFDKLDNIAKSKATFLTLAKYLFFRLPQICFDLWPILVSLSGLLALAFLVRGGEIFAFRTLGFSCWRLSLPYLFLAFVFTFFFLLLEAPILPQSTFKAFYTWEVKVRKREPRGLVVRGRLFFRGVNSFFVGHVLTPDASFLRDVTYAKVNREGLPILIIWAKRAHFQNGRWVFYDGLYKDLHQGMKPIWFDKLNRKLEFSPETVLVVKRLPRTQFLRELWAQRNFLKEAKLPTVIPESEIAYRLFYPLAGPFLLFLALPVFLGEKGQQSLGKGLSFGLLAIALGLGVVMGAKALGDKGLLPPLLALPLGLFLLSCFSLLFFRLRRF